jgi:menaquinone-dependent protoporphyrinogen IX oxidase
MEYYQNITALISANPFSAAAIVIGAFIYANKRHKAHANFLKVKY